LVSAGRRASIATGVRIELAYRRPGTKCLLKDDDRTLAEVGGGCPEADASEVAFIVQ